METGIYKKIIDPKTETLGERLKRMRTENHFTQKHVADALNIDRSTYTYYERGKTEPNHATTIKLARIFNVSVQEIVTGEPIPVLQDEMANKVLPASKKPEDMIEEDDTNEERGLMAKFRCLPDDKRKEVLDFVQNLIEEDNKKKYFYKNQKSE